MRRFRSALLGDEAKSGKGSGALAPATVKKYVNLLATVFKYAERTGLVEKSPVEGMGFIPRGRGSRIASARDSRSPSRSIPGAWPLVFSPRGSWVGL